MEHRMTTESVVLSITDVSQGVSQLKKPVSTGERPISGDIVRSIAGIHKLFEDVIKSSRHIQKVHLDAADLVLKVRIQQVIFDNGCKMLLVTAAKSRQDVDNMLEDRSHPIWRDTDAHRTLDAMMARFYHLCLPALEHFQESLHELREGIHALRGQGADKATKIYGFLLENSNSPTLGTTEDFPELLDKLRSYNDIFCTLILQAVPHHSNHQFGSSFGAELGCPYGGARVSHHHFDCIERASQVLYDTLSHAWTCRDHKAHALNIALNLDNAKAEARAQAETLRFGVAVTCPYFEDRYHFVVRTAHRNFCMHREVNEDSSLKKTLLMTEITRSAVGIDSSEQSQLDADTATHRVGGKRAGNLESVPDLSLEEDLCCWLRSLSVTIEAKQAEEYSSIGFLESKSGCIFLFSCPQRDKYRKQDLYSLDDVLMDAHNERRTIPLQDRLRTALCLAAGVLHLNTSSWLRRTWSSNDVHFLNIDGYERCIMGEPFLQSKLDNNTVYGPVNETESAAATRSCLLSLGLVLIELAFSAPWRKLQLEERLTGDLLEWERNLLNLMHRSNIVSRELGSKYAKVVQICLFQGMETNGTDHVGKAELDEVIFEDIVRELDRCLSAVTL